MLDAAKPKNVTRYAALASLLTRHVGVDVARTVPLLSALIDKTTTRASPEELVVDLESRGPTFVKFGQMLASRPDLLPPAYIEALQRLQSDVEPVSVVEIRAIIEDELGASIDTLFSSFDDAPAGAASIGQVHRATLRDGRPVVVKVQRPDIRTQVREDLDAFVHVAAALERHSTGGKRYGTIGILRDFRETLLSELDYEQEARNLVAMGELLEEYSQIFVPQPVLDYTTSRVLTMDYVDGVGLSDVHPVVFTELNREVLSRQLSRAYLDQILLHGYFHADPHPGNLKLMADRRLGLLDLGQVSHLGPRNRRVLLQVLLAIMEGRSTDVAGLLRQMGQELAEFDALKLQGRVTKIVNETASPSAAEGRVGAALLALARACAQSGLRPPPVLSTLGKTLLQLDEVAQTLDPQADSNKIISKYSTELMAKHAVDQARPAELYHTFLEGTTFLRNAPGHLDQILNTAASNGFRVRTEVGGIAEILTAVRKVANRITVGIVLAATIIGASLMMSVETRVTLLGYPALAAVMLIFSVVLGMGLVVNILWSDWRASRRQQALHTAG